MEKQHGQMTIFDVLDNLDLFQFKKSSTDKKKNVDNNIKQPRKIGYIVRR